jgi:hypothetical protein
MSEYLESDFGTVDEGLDYIFARLSGVYGAAFTRHWEGIDIEIVRNTWAEIVGRYLTYRPALDFAVKYCDISFVPSALAIRKLCEENIRIPIKPEATLEYKPSYDFSKEIKETVMDNGMTPGAFWLNEMKKKLKMDGAI